MWPNSSSQDPPRETTPTIAPVASLIAGPPESPWQIDRPTSNSCGPRVVWYFETPLPFASFVLRGTAEPEGLTSAARAAILEVDPAVPIYDVRSMETRVAESVAQPRFQTLLLGAFSAVALLLAAIGAPPAAADALWKSSCHPAVDV